MCGLCGFVGSPNPSVLTAMTDALAHRGPDGRGEFVDGDVSLGHRRLAIVDVARGAQPFSSPDDNLVVVFNGEIYNHPRLRSQLEARGHRYRTHSDTETILHAYAEWGVDCPSHLDGMFAFVVYDRRRQVLFGARDRFGKKPLYLTTRPFEADGERVEFAFASEMKSLQEHPAIAGGLRLSESAVVSYLLHDYVLGRPSVYEGIDRLPAAHAFTYDLNGEFRSWPYWDLSLETTPASEQETYEDACQQIERLFMEAVESRLMSDVPLGVLLSGGVDSSAVLAVLAAMRPAKDLDTFSIGFDEPSFDESPWATKVARHFGTRHHSRRFTASELCDRFPKVMGLMDEPFADPSLLPVSLLCEFAREHVTVALSGDGGDEVFAGYDPFKAVAPARRYSRFVPEAIHNRLIVPLTRWLPASDANMALQFKVARFLRGALCDAAIRPAAWMGPFSLPQIERLIPEWDGWHDKESAYAPILEVARRRPGRDLSRLDYALEFFQRFYLTDDILVKADRGSMMHGLEVRSPFLDTALVEFVNGLPSEWKLQGGTTKAILKRILTRSRGKSGEPWLPADVVHRKKKGFGIPVARWIRTDLRDSFRETLLGDWPEAQLPMFNRWEIERLFEAHVTGRENNYKELWALYVLAHWTRAQTARAPVMAIAQ